MKKVLLLFICLIISLGSYAQMDVAAQAKQHPIEWDKPAINFFEGALLGNGGMGVVVTTRPDAILFHFGHNNVWDIRVAENNKEKIGTFEDVFEKAKALSPDLKAIWEDKEFYDYLRMTSENYHKPYPRPFPCGTALLGFDRREVELLGHQTDISNGLCEVYLLHQGKKNILKIFTDMDADILWFRLVDEKQNPIPSFFNRFRIIPDNKTPKEFPDYQLTNGETSLGFTQRLPYLEPELYDPEKGHPKDKAFTLEARLSSSLVKGHRYTVYGLEEELHPLERYIVPNETPMVGSIILTEGLASTLEQNKNNIPEVSIETFGKALERTTDNWNKYWNKSGVTLDDDFLEKIWYWNHYFYHCAVKEGVTCPGIFANWSLGDIGTAWHGDYHLNYNTQQPFWLPFSSNRLDKNLAYVDLVHHLLPISKKWAKEYYGMRGAFFPHSAYPVDMSLHPYPVPDWGWEVFETPWMVQGLWWHYLYSNDIDFLKDKAFAPIKEAVLFLVDYMKREDAHGKQWGDTQYHIFPSVPPELYGLQPGFKYNYDTQIDITLTRFIFNAYLTAVKTLKLNRQEAALTKEVKMILPNLPEYSTVQTGKFGKIYTSVPGEGEHIVYNVPANLTHVFPGEEYGIDAPTEIYETLVNTYNAHQNEGGNDIVFLNLQGARLGVLDLEKFKRQINYAMLPNKTVSDLILQTGGRYDDQTDFAYMGTMGIWFENFALPAVINECLMQSYNGTISLFPNWDKSKNASFSTLRAVGAFLVSSRLTAGKVEQVTLISEKGSACRIKNPWGNSPVQLIREGKPAETLTGETIEFATRVNEKIELKIK